jgi:flagellar biosynthetic protein FliQ
MNEYVVIDIAKQALTLVIKAAAPMLLASLIVGLTVSLFQTVTSIQEHTLTFVPKMIAIFVAIILFGSWIMTSLKEFMIELVSNFSNYIRLS